MACGKASLPTQPRLTGYSGIPPNAISAAKYWRRAYVYRAAVQATKMHFKAQILNARMACRDFESGKGGLLLDRIELTS
jgi:hypothetical protein